MHPIRAASLAIAAASSLALAQAELDWINLYGDLSLNDRTKDLIAADGGFVMLGSRDSAGSGLHDLSIVRFNADGTVAWDEIIDYMGVDGSDEPVAIHTDANGNLYAGFTSWGLGRSFATVRLDPNGNVVWEARDTNDGAPGDSVTDSNGNTYLAGFRQPGNIQVVKIGPSGSVEWNRLYNGPGGAFDNAFAIDLLPGGDVVVTGFAEGPSGDDIPILRYEPDGDLVYARLYDTGSPTDGAFDVAVDSLGGIFIVGEGRPQGGFNNDIVVTKYDADGNFLWDDAYDGVMGFNDEPAFDRGLCARVAPNGDFLALGFSDEAETGTDIIVRRYSTDGDLLWSRSSAQDVGVSLYESPTGMTVGPDGSVYVSGSKEIITPGNPGLGGGRLGEEEGPDTTEFGLIAKYSPGGVLMWEALIALDGYRGAINDIAIDPVTQRVAATGVAFPICPEGPGGRGMGCGLREQIVVLSIDQSCDVDLNADGRVNFNDILIYLNLFSAGDPLANLTGPDGGIDFNDFVAYLDRFATGCP